VLRSAPRLADDGTGSAVVHSLVFFDACTSVADALLVGGGGTRKKEKDVLTWWIVYNEYSSNVTQV